MQNAVFHFPVPVTTPRSLCQTVKSGHGTVYTFKGNIHAGLDQVRADHNHRLLFFCKNFFDGCNLIASVRGA